MSTNINLHNIESIEVRTNGAMSFGELTCWQTFVFFDREGRQVAEVTAYLNGLQSAAECGEVPAWLAQQATGQQAPVRKHLGLVSESH
jgi:hypothetical protein